MRGAARLSASVAQRPLCDEALTRSVAASRAAHLSPSLPQLLILTSDHVLLEQGSV